MGCAWRWLLGVLLLLSSASVAAADAPAPGGLRRGRGQSAAAAALLDKGRAALQAKELTGARRALEQAYRAAAVPEALFLLGRVAEADGRLLDAHDLMRRFLIDPARIPDDAAVTEAQRVVQLARPPSGQIVVLGAPGSLVLVDERLVGSVPLAQPLLVSPGEHRITLQLGTRRLDSPVLVQAGRSFEVRFTQQSGAVLITLLPAVLWVTEQVGVPEEAQNPLRDAAEQAARAANQTLLTAEAALARAPELKECQATTACQQNLARKNEVEYILSLRVVREGLPPAVSSQPAAPSPPAPPPVLSPTAAPTPPPAAVAPGLGSWQLTLSLWHADLPTPAATGTGACPRCTTEQAAAELKKTTAKLLTEGLRRSHSSFTVTSEPAAAEVRIAGKAVGVTPFTQAAWAGSYELELRHQNFEPVQRTITVGEGPVVAVTVTLDPVAGPEPAPVKPLPLPVLPPLKRPVWRLATGAALIGAGIILLGVGGAAVHNSDQCVDHFCTAIYGNFIPAGGSLLAVGTVLPLAGVVLLALPPSKPKPPRPPAP